MQVILTHDQPTAVDKPFAYGAGLGGHMYKHRCLGQQIATLVQHALTYLRFRKFSSVEL